MEIVVDLDSWVRAAVGGSMIGLASILLFSLNGRIAGISGIMGGLFLERRPSETGWRALFLAGLVVGALMAATIRPDLARSDMVTGWGGVMLAGLIVGFGTRMGRGCTSGHGVCGIARLSRRSIVATLVFMVAGIATVFVTRHVLGAA